MALGISAVLMISLLNLNTDNTTSVGNTSQQLEVTTVSEMHREVIDQHWQAATPRVRSEICTAHNAGSGGGFLFIPLLRAEFGTSIRTEEEARTWSRAGDKLLDSKCGLKS